MNLLSQLPEYIGNRETIVDDHTVKDIMQQVCAAHKKHASEYGRIAAEFWRGSVKATADYLFNFCKRNMKYKVEPSAMQTTRSPAAILETAQTWGVDCKHYALFIGGILDALKRQGHRIDWFYRFASYKWSDDTPEHVFVVVKVDGENYYVDPVMSSVNKRFPIYFHKFDKKCSMLQHISGVPMVQFETPEAIIPRLQRSDAMTMIAVNEPTPTDKDSSGLWLLGGAALLYYFYTQSKKRKK